MTVRWTVNKKWKLDCQDSLQHKFAEPEQGGICFEICGSQEKKEESVRNHVSVRCGRLQLPGLEKQEQKTDSVLQVLGTNTRSRTLRNSESGLSLRKRISHSSSIGLSNNGLSKGLLGLHVRLGCYFYSLYKCFPAMLSFFCLSCLGVSWLGPSRKSIVPN